MIVVVGDNAYKPEEDDQPVPLTQAELDELTRDLNLAKESAQRLGVSLKKKHRMAPRITIFWYRDHERELRQFFVFQDKSSLIYCNNIAGLFNSMGLEYNATEGRLFIESTSRSLKAVLLYKER